MSFLVNLVRAMGRFFGWLRDMLVLVLLTLIYLFGVGLMALGRLAVSVGRGGRTSDGLQPAERPDLTRDGLGRMG